MSNACKIGNWLYNRQDLPLYSKILKAIGKSGAGVAMAHIVKAPDITKDFGGDENRAKTKCGTMLGNLKTRRVIAEFRGSEGFVVYKIINKNDALDLIKQASEVSERVADLTVKSASVTINDVAGKSANTEKKMSEKKAKVVRMWLNPETNAVEPFGVGRPNKAKLAFECDSKGTYKNASAAAAFVQNGLKADEKLTKAELLVLVRTLRAEVSSLSAALAKIDEDEDEVAEEDSEVAAEDTDTDEDSDTSEDTDEDEVA